MKAIDFVDAFFAPFSRKRTSNSTVGTVLNTPISYKMVVVIAETTVPKVVCKRIHLKFSAKDGQPLASHPDCLRARALSVVLSRAMAY